jgi:hypothetical protein
MSTERELTTAETYKKELFEYLLEDTYEDVFNAVRKSLEHHRRLRVYAHNLHPRTNVDKEQMIDDIGENHMAEYCELCKMFVEECSMCPMLYWSNCCAAGDSAWATVNDAKTYGEYFKAERALIRILTKMYNEIAEEVES